MKKILLGVLFLVIFANSATINQSSVIGNWTLEKPQKSGSIVSLEADTMKLTSDWKLVEVSIYDINYPDYGPQKINLKYKLKIISEGEYRLDSELKKYPKNPTIEIEDGSMSDAEAAQNSRKEIEKLIKEEYKNFMPILSVSETELELQATNKTLKFTKPKNLPISKLTRDTVPFFAPEGWRFPESAKELASFPIRLKNDPKNLFTVVKGDFNGDGYVDAAAYLLNESTGQVALFVNMSLKDGTYDLSPYGSADKNVVIENGVMLTDPGEYVNTATKAKVTIENPAFITIVFNTAANLVYWHPKFKEWVTIPLGKRF
ncbi:MAG: hypothetical protein LBC75_07800 [Fibromonadaceae bacterium]|jgi:hypothetical protein|nr:hypothetical protein [Fibromonadaceae bacterium]